MKLIQVLLTFVLLSGCATAPRMEEALTFKRTLPASKDQTWAAVVATVGDGYQIKTIDKESGILTTEGKQMHVNDSIKVMRVPGYIIMGGYTARMGLNVRVTPAGESTELAVTGNPEVYPANMGKPDGTWFACKSKGLIESNFLAKVEAKLAPKN